MATWNGDPNWHRKLNKLEHTISDHTHTIHIDDTLVGPGLAVGTPVEIIWAHEYVGQYGYIVSCNESAFYAVELECGDIVVLPNYTVSARSSLEALASAAD